MKILEFFKRIEHNIKIKSIAHHDMFKLYQNIQYFIEYPCIILSFICTSSIIVDYYNNYNFSDIISLNIINFFLMIIINIIKLLKIKEKLDLHNYYSKEYSRLYMVILNYKDYIIEHENYKLNLNINNDKLLDNISDYHFNKFISMIHNHVYYLTKDEPYIIKRILYNVQYKQNDIYFYFISTKNKKNKYSLKQLSILCNLEIDELLYIIKYIFNDIDFQIYNNGNYPLVLDDKNKINKNYLLNYILIDKNVSFNIILEIIKKNNENFEIELKTITIDDIECKYDNFDLL